ncbi:MAG: hypothetical protein OXG04_28730 [Acidobacteria bacterium]|nr:hypothetical protein [Acidobacteriota bacterium]
MRMDRMDRRFDNLEVRVDRIEQILPTLATKDDLQAAIEPLATKAELQAAKEELRAEIAAAVEPLATKLELRELRTEVLARIADSEQRMRTHFDVVTESLRDDIKLIAAAFESLADRDRQDRGPS